MQTRGLIGCVTYPLHFILDGILETDVHWCNLLKLVATFF